MCATLHVCCATQPRRHIAQLFGRRRCAITACARLQLQLTQAVGRAEDGSVSHLATVRWSDTGVPVATVHTNFLAPTARPAPMTFIISGRVSVAARAAAVYATAPARNAATASALSSPALPIPAPSARSPAYPYLSPAPAKPGDASPGWNAVARGPAPKWPKPSKPLKPLARARMRVLEASNANVPRQPCAFHFNKPHGAYWLTWQRFHILARWRCGPVATRSALCALSISCANVKQFACVCHMQSRPHVERTLALHVAGHPLLRHSCAQFAVRPTVARGARMQRPAE